MYVSMWAFFEQGAFWKNVPHALGYMWWCAQALVDRVAAAEIAVLEQPAMWELLQDFPKLESLAVSQNCACEQEILQSVVQVVDADMSFGLC